MAPSRAMAVANPSRWRGMGERRSLAPISMD